jgi:hypothetical protein
MHAGTPHEPRDVAGELFRKRSALPLMPQEVEVAKLSAMMSTTTRNHPFLYGSQAAT